MKNIFVLLLSCILFVGSGSIALATNGYQLIGVGQTQKSMAGAVTAAPMDSMTAITNPAGMARIGKRANFSMEAFMPVRSVDFSVNGGGSTEGGSELYGIPSIGWTAPAFNRDNMFFGGGMYGTSGLGVDYDQTVFMPGAALDQSFGAPSGTFSNVTFSGYSAIQFWKMAPTVAINFNDKLSAGFALNMDYQSITISQKIRNVPFWNDPSNPLAGVTQMDVNFDLGRPTNQMGFGATIGVIYDIIDQVSVGASYSSEQFFSEGEFRVGDNDILNFNGAVGKAGTYEMDLNYPQQLALGVALKPIPPLLIALDFKWIGWSGTHDEVTFTGPSNAFDSNGDGVGDSDETTLDFGWDDQYVYAIGIQYTVNDALRVRTGYNFSEAPIDEADVFNNLVFPAVVEQHFTLGVDYMMGDHWGIGMTYMKAFKETVEGSGDVPAGFQQTTPFTADSGTEITLEEDSVGIELTYLF